MISHDDHSQDKEQDDLPVAEDAWSIPVPDADQNPPDLVSDSDINRGGEMEIDSENAMPRPVEAWTDELADDDAVAADETSLTKVEDSDEAVSETEFPESVESWSIAGDPNQSEED
jgi:hypothetical protein